MRQYVDGQKVILSVGGQNGTISVDDPASAASFASSVYSIIQQFADTVAPYLATLP